MRHSRPIVVTPLEARLAYQRIGEPVPRNLRPWWRRAADSAALIIACSSALAVLL